jgi:hypothetical protein
MDVSKASWNVLCASRIRSKNSATLSIPRRPSPIKICSIGTLAARAFSSRLLFSSSILEATFGWRISRKPFVLWGL